MKKMKKETHILLGISGASGAIYGIKLLEILASLDIKTHLIISDAAKITIHHETDYDISKLSKMAYKYYNNKDITACASSGSFLHHGMIIAPCSIKSMSEISSGITSTLLTRAADVTLKEKRKLILLVRETPVHTGHLRSMTQLSEIGAIIAPPLNAFYIKPESIDDLVTHTALRTLDIMNIKHNIDIKRWGGLIKK